MRRQDVQHVFIVGSKGIPGSYGGYETFVDKLTEYHQDEEWLKYHVACKADEDGEFEYHNARCFKVKVPDIGPAQAIYYDVVALQRVVAYIKKTCDQASRCVYIGMPDWTVLLALSQGDPQTRWKALCQSRWT